CDWSSDVCSSDLTVTAWPVVRSLIDTAFRTDTTVLPLLLTVFVVPSFCVTVRVVPEMLLTVPLAKLLGSGRVRPLGRLLGGGAPLPLPFPPHRRAPA